MNANDHSLSGRCLRRRMARCALMPFAGNSDFKANPRLITAASGACYTTADGRKVFDGLSVLRARAWAARDRRI